MANVALFYDQFNIFKIKLILTNALV